MNHVAEPTEDNAARTPSEIVAGKIAARLVEAGLLDPARAAGFEKALGSGKVKPADLRFDLEIPEK